MRRTDSPVSLTFHGLSVILLAAFMAAACSTGGGDRTALVALVRPSIPFGIGGLFVTSTPGATETPIGTIPPRPTPAGSPFLDIPLHLEEEAGVARTDEPVRSGVPMPRGLGLLDPGALALVGPAGEVVPAQIRVTSRWEGAPDDETKPIKWVLLDFPASVPANADAVYHLTTTRVPAALPPSMIAEDSASRIVVKTGAATFQISKTRFDLFDRVLLSNGVELVGSDPNGGVYLTAPDGTRFLAAAGATTVSVEEDGPLHAVVVAKGKHASSAGGKLLDFEIRLHFYRDRAESKVDYTFTDRDLPKISNYVSVNEAGISLSEEISGPTTWTIGGENGDLSGALASSESIRETGGLDPALSGTFDPGNADTIHWTASGDRAGSGGKAPGWIDVSGANGGITAAVRWFWQNYPKKLQATPGALRVILWPAEEPDMRVYAAAAKTHEVIFSFHRAGVSGASVGRALAARFAEPLFARAEPQWYARSWVWNRIGTADPADYPRSERSFVSGYFDHILGTVYPAAFVTRRFDNNGKGHAYSMWDFGDGRESDWSNLAYDTPRSLFMFWGITGDREFLDRGFESAAFLRDVLIEHSPQDTRAGLHPNRGVAQPYLGRTRYTPNGPNAHDLGNPGRTGYCFEHSKGQSLADLYFLTGDMLAKEVLAETYHYYLQWKVDADDGYHRTDGTRVVSHMLLIVLSYYDAFGTQEARDRADFIVSFLNDWQRRTTGSDPQGWMWMSAGDSTSAFMNGVTAEAMMLYEVDFPDGIPVRQNLVDAAKFTVDPSKRLLVDGSQGKYFNAWTGDNYGVSHASCLDPMTAPLLGYAYGATGSTSYASLAKTVVSEYETQDNCTPFLKAYTQQTRLMPSFLWFLQTPEARAEGGAQQ